jgi:hypothetical protein
MWYLPPECFVVGPTAPRISGKVSHLLVTVMCVTLLNVIVTVPVAICKWLSVCAREKR